MGIIHLETSRTVEFEVVTPPPPPPIPPIAWALIGLVGAYIFYKAVVEKR